MKVLAIDSSSASACAALCDDEFLLGEYYVNIRQTHSETLMPEIGELFSRCRVAPKEIDLVAVCAGPGSFTGVRIGVSAAKGLALPKALPCAAVSSLEAAAANLPYFGGIVCPVMDARRGQFYNALFDTSSGVPERLTPDRAVSAEDLKKELEEYGKNVVFVGDGAKLCYNISIDGVSTFTAPEALRYVRAACVAEIGLRIFRAGGAVTAEELTPFYLRLPQAERELRAKTER